MLDPRTAQAHELPGASLAWEDLTAERDGGVLKRVLRPAPGSAPAPTASSPRCQLQYHGTVAATGEVFDSCRTAGVDGGEDYGDHAGFFAELDRQFALSVGARKVIKGWEVRCAALRCAALRCARSPREMRQKQ